MRITPRHWHNETWICSMRGHVAPAATVAVLTDDDRRLGLVVDDVRYVRCLRCDGWFECADPTPEQVTSERMPAHDELALPRRGKQLQDAIVLRLVAINKGLHAVAFTLAALAIVALEVKLPGLKHSATEVRQLVDGALDSAGRNPARQVLSKGADRVLGLDVHELKVLLAISSTYAVVEAVEAVGLWKDQRWAEYVTAVATAGFLPLEIYELSERITVLRIGALVVNVAVLVWLVLTKHLFGVRGGPTTLHAHTDWAEILDRPTPAPFLGNPVHAGTGPADA